MQLCLNIKSSRSVTLPAIFCNEVNALYWVTLPRVIYSFDLHHVKFQDIQLPTKHFTPYLVEFKGYLFVAEIEHVENSRMKIRKVHLHKLLIKNNNIDEQVWIKETFLLPFHDRIRFVGFSDQVLLTWFEMDEKRFTLYNFHRNHRKLVHRPSGLDRTGFGLTRHAESFLSLRRANVMDFYPPLGRIVKHRPRTSVIGVVVFLCLLT